MSTFSFLDYLWVLIGAVELGLLWLLAGCDVPEFLCTQQRSVSTCKDGAPT